MIERNVGFIGAGVMGEALLSGMLSAGAATAARLYASDPSRERREALAEKIGPHSLEANVELVRACQVVVLSVKPDVVPAVARGIAAHLTPEHLVVSIAAGVRLDALTEMLGSERLVRVMPNTPAMLGAGASAYCPGSGATEGDAALVEEMLGAAGLCVRVDDEALMDAVTGLSGSGPAYVYLVVEAMAAGGVRAGLAPEVAERLAAQTALGAARMVVETGRDPARLRDEVTTPGGTTEQGLRVLEEAGVRQAFADAVKAAAAKSRQLSRPQ
jgi:pyrroline-5-carboxylate reductase